ncbi:MAG: bifunctional precorrin-2 dehydrogenase/sirohydrochlorin ferrochelatase [Spirochaetes bacterium]|nr:bifunctional precorrin-2 dehydrogenase/sirohydrochlorin ferrochelatase [Spirochaetota bacterium]
MLYPIMYNIKGKRVVVIGGGQVALRKVKDLTSAGAHVVVIAPYIHHELEEFAATHTSVTIEKRSYQYGDCKGATLVFSATNNKEINRKVFDEALALNIPINAVDDPDNSSFYVPSFFTRGLLLVAVSTGGASPAMAAKVRRLIEQSIPQDIEIVLDVMNEIRRILKQDFAHLEVTKRSDILKAIANDDTLVEQAKEAYKKNTLREFLNKMINK